MGYIAGHRDLGIAEVGRSVSSSLLILLSLGDI